MRRREFIKSIGGWAIAWPLAADAQDAKRVRRIGVLLTLTAEDPETKAGLAAFRQVLQRSGWDEGRGVQIEYRTAEGDAGRIRQYVAELVALAARCHLRGW
jgi:putative ABC transport system substrate-binding protein